MRRQPPPPHHHFLSLFQIDLLEPGNNRKVVSVLAIATSLPIANTEGVGTIAVFCIKFATLSTAIALPLLQHILLAWLWWAPMPLHTQQRLAFAIRRLSAWTTFEVLVAGIFASGFGSDFSTITKQLTDPVCENIDVLLAEYTVNAGIFSQYLSSAF